MSNLDLTISDIFYGDTAVLKIMKGDVQKWPNVPYDAEVEWLRSDGASYIDAGIVPDFNTEIKIKATIISWLTSGVLIGVRNNGTNSNGRYLPLSQSSTNSRTCLGNEVVTINSSTLPMYSLFELLFNENSTHKVYLNESLVTTFSGGVVVNNSNTLYIFAANGYSPNTYPCIARIYYLQIKQNGNLIRDYIPVRKNGVGYLYDKISGQLFGNAGTGSFTFQSNNAPYDAEVEYLQGDGIAYINTGISFANGNHIILDCQFTNNYSSSQTIAGFSASGGCWVGNVATKQFGIKAEGIGDSSVRTTLQVTWDYTALKTYLTIGNTTNSTTLNANVSSKTFSMFGSPSGYCAYAKVYACILYSASNAVIANFIPVRKDGVGYLYDKVSGQLFGNANSSGSFTYGNDI